MPGRSIVKIQVDQGHKSYERENVTGLWHGDRAWHPNISAHAQFKTIHRRHSA